MILREWIELLLYIAIFVGLTPLLGTYMAHVFQGQHTFAHPALGWLERLCYGLGGISPNEEMTWQQYGKSLLIFNLLGLVVLFGILMAQGMLPLNPQQLPGVSWPLALNISASFVTNTNWQSYAGETTLSHFSQMVGLTVQNFLSAATGVAVILVLIRGFTRQSSEAVGNYWVDMVRTVVYVLLPLSLILAILLMSQGVVQTLSANIEITTLENQSQIIPLGPVASQVAIKQIGTNGGGFFNANSAHPFENPTGFSNFLEALAIIIIPSALTYTYGILVGARRQGWLLLLVIVLWAGGLSIATWTEHLYNPVLEAYPLMEGKETRFGVTNSVLWAVTTTATANGSVNAMLSSLSPLAGGVALANILLGEIVFGGIGVGLCGMLMFVLLTVFLSGLMVGRTPEYLGKKIESKEMRLVSIAVLTPGALTLIGAGLACILPIALSSLGNSGPHGLTEMMYAFASAAGNNGSAFAGLNANTPFFNLSLSAIMLTTRCTIILSSLAIAGLLARKKITPPSIGTLSTDTVLFFFLLGCVILIFGALTYFPALALGPIVEHFLMQQGRVF